MNYGVPYQGSKSRIARWVMSHLPKAETLYDVFAGGCAITHVALLSNRFKRVVCNDITDAPSLFLDAVKGKFHDCDRWVSRDEFEMFKDTDPFVRIVWSFGNNNKTYLYHRDVEPFKRELHKLAFSKTPSERVLQFEKVVAKMQEYNVTNLKLQSLQSLKRLQNLERPLRGIVLFTATLRTKARLATPQSLTMTLFTIGAGRRRTRFIFPSIPCPMISPVLTRLRYQPC